MQSYFGSERFPDNLPAGVWEPQWAHLASAGGAAVVLGEQCVPRCPQMTVPVLHVSVFECMLHYVSASKVQRLSLA